MNLSFLKGVLWWTLFPAAAAVSYQDLLAFEKTLLLVHNSVTCAPCYSRYSYSYYLFPSLFYLSILKKQKEQKTKKKKTAPTISPSSNYRQLVGLLICKALFSFSFFVNKRLLVVVYIKIITNNLYKNNSLVAFDLAIKR